MRNCHNLGGDDQLVHFVTDRACLVVSSEGDHEAACHEVYFEAYLEELIAAVVVAYFGASLLDGPCVVMHDTMAKSYWNLVEPYHSPYYYQKTAEAECKHYMIGEESRGEESRDEGIHDGETRYGTLAEASEGQHCPERMTGFSD